ncbi:unnamed protein product [Closterium sp. Yama58-4]|nr:unnamed protein product [Closterium sp. Yama58-4]
MIISAISSRRKFHNGISAPSSSRPELQLQMLQLQDAVVGLPPSLLRGRTSLTTTGTMTAPRRSSPVEWDLVATVLARHEVPPLRSSIRRRDGHPRRGHPRRCLQGKSLRSPTRRRSSGRTLQTRVALQALDRRYLRREDPISSSSTCKVFQHNDYRVETTVSGRTSKPDERIYHADSRCDLPPTFLHGDDVKLKLLQAEPTSQPEVYWLSPSTCRRQRRTGRPNRGLGDRPTMATRKRRPATIADGATRPTLSAAFFDAEAPSLRPEASSRPDTSWEGVALQSRDASSSGHEVFAAKSSNTKTGEWTHSSPSDDRRLSPRSGCRLRSLTCAYRRLMLPWRSKVVLLPSATNDLPSTTPILPSTHRQRRRTYLASGRRGCQTLGDAASGRHKRTTTKERTKHGGRRVVTLLRASRPDGTSRGRTARLAVGRLVSRSDVAGGWRVSRAVGERRIPRFLARRSGKSGSNGKLRGLFFLEREERQATRTSLNLEEREEREQRQATRTYFKLEEREEREQRQATRTSFNLEEREEREQRQATRTSFNLCRRSGRSGSNGKLRGLLLTWRSGRSGSNGKLRGLILTCAGATGSGSTALAATGGQVRGLLILGVTGAGSTWQRREVKLRGLLLTWTSESGSTSNRGRQRQRSNTGVVSLAWRSGDGSSRRGVAWRRFFGGGVTRARRSIGARWDIRARRTAAAAHGKLVPREAPHTWSAESAGARSRSEVQGARRKERGGI